MVGALEQIGAVNNELGDKNEAHCGINGECEQKETDSAHLTSEQRGLTIDCGRGVTGEAWGKREMKNANDTGARVRVTEEIDLQPYTVLQGGEEGGTITKFSVTDELGIVSLEVRMDKRHAGLNYWENVAYLVDPELSFLEILEEPLNPKPLAMLAVAVSIILLL